MGAGLLRHRGLREGAMRRQNITGGCWQHRGWRESPIRLAFNCRIWQPYLCQRCALRCSLDMNTGWTRWPPGYLPKLIRSRPCISAWKDLHVGAASFDDQSSVQLLPEPEGSSSPRPKSNAGAMPSQRWPSVRDVIPAIILPATDLIVSLRSACRENGYVNINVCTYITRPERQPCILYINMAWMLGDEIISPVPSKHETLPQRWFTVGPTS